MKPQLKNKLSRILGITVITTLAAFIAVGGFLLHAASKKREFSGKIAIKVCKKLPNGQWQEIDKAEGPLSFESNLIDVVSGKEFTTNRVWSSTSAKAPGPGVMESGGSTPETSARGHPVRFGRVGIEAVGKGGDPCLWDEGIQARGGAASISFRMATVFSAALRAKVETSTYSGTFEPSALRSEQ